LSEEIKYPVKCTFVAQFNLGYAFTLLAPDNKMELCNENKMYPSMVLSRISCIINSRPYAMVNFLQVEVVPPAVCDEGFLDALQYHQTLDPEYLIWGDMGHTISSRATWRVSGTEIQTQSALSAQKVPKNLPQHNQVEHYRYVPQWNTSSIGGVIKPMTKLFISQLAKF